MRALVKFVNILEMILHLFGQTTPTKVMHISTREIGFEMACMMVFIAVYNSGELCNSLICIQSFVGIYFLRRDVLFRPQ